jgi:hypothetical protein
MRMMMPKYGDAESDIDLETAVISERHRLRVMRGGPDVLKR